MSEAGDEDDHEYYLATKTMANALMWSIHKDGIDTLPKLVAHLHEQYGAVPCVDTQCHACRTPPPGEPPAQAADVMLYCILDGAHDA